MFMSVYLFYTTKYVTSRLSNFYWPTAATIPWEKVRFSFSNRCFCIYVLAFFLFIFLFIYSCWFNSKKMFINRLRMSEHKLFKLFGLQSTLALQTPRYYGHHPIRGQKPDPRRNAQRNNWNNSRHYGLPLLRKSRFVQTPDSHDMKRHHDKGK